MPANRKIVTFSTFLAHGCWYIEENERNNMASQPFNQTRRAELINDLSSECFDVLVIGGGITGAGVARDAAMRGLSVALIEAQDLASGTSSRSSKMIHGGLRYLVSGDVAVVKESASERSTLHRIAPHLAQKRLMSYQPLTCRVS